MRRALAAVLLMAILAAPAVALDRPWISVTFFYWYTWDYQTELGGWMGGVYNTPLRGYYDSRAYEDNLASLHDASEWGVTHHFMDYWGPGWVGLDNEARELTVMRAAEALRERGYDTWMSVYQDGTDFDMEQFAKNLDPKRDTEFYLRLLGDSPAFPRVNDKPIALIYGRNGAPKVTASSEGFQDHLKRKYGDIAALNDRWGTDFGVFGDVTLDTAARGHQRAESIKYIYQQWEAEMQRANAAARTRLNLPGCVFSWDIAYQPYMGFGYSDQARVFCGPHSYGGIFGVPHDQDVERFIQAAVAKRYDTVFFDTFKNFYHDWEIRIPGTCYPPDFNAFDRFWVQALAHYSEALLHLSWNEWWEGSNLEPCVEYGKVYCEKNLLYSTIMKECFDSIREWNKGAKVAVLLNDWHWLAGGRHPEDIYTCIQALRRNNVRFDLIPDDFVTSEELAKFDVLLAPSGGVGFGYNAADESISELISQWAAADANRRLLVDDFPGADGLFDLETSPAQAAVAAQPGPDMNAYVDIGVEGDDHFLLDGFSGRENWGKLPPDKFGATDRDMTVRWTPAVGTRTVLLMPFSPRRDHVLRLKGSAIRGHEVRVLVEGRLAATFDVREGNNDYEVLIPGAVVGDTPYGELMLDYQKPMVPTEIDPVKYPSEHRSCNLALDWLQLATSNQPFSTEPNFTLPKGTVTLSEATQWRDLSGKTIEGSWMPHRPLTTAADRILSRYSDGVAREMLATEAGNVVFVNGRFDQIDPEAYLDALLGGWAGCKRELVVDAPEGVMVTALEADETQVLLAYNSKAPEPKAVEISLEDRGPRPIVEVRALSLDGETGTFQETHPAPGRPGVALLHSAMDYYGVFQVTRGRVGLSTPELALVPGQELTVNLKLTHRAGDAATGTVSLASHLPSLTAEPVRFTVTPGQTITVPMTIKARDDVDWGTKTVVFKVDVDGQTSNFWRELLVQRLPDLQVTSRVIDTRKPVATVTSKPFPWAKDAQATDVRLVMGGGSETAGDIAQGESARVNVPRCPEPGKEITFTPTAAGLEYTVGGMRKEKGVTLGLLSYPQGFAKAPDAVLPLIVTNPHDEYLENHLVSFAFDPAVLDGKPAYIRERGGNVVPSQVVGGNVIYWIAMLPAKSATVFSLCAGDAPQPSTDLAVEQDGAGIRVRNSRLSLGWSGERGGTLTSLVSNASGKDYGIGSCGAGYGTWGEYDPLKPAINTVAFVSQEKKRWQRDLQTPAKITVGLNGPVLATVDVEAELGDGYRCSQRYMIGAYQSDFTVGGEISGPQARELVALDIRLARNDLTKIFPNFTGIGEGFEGDNPHAGWREANDVPPVATMMTPDHFRESISVIPWDMALMPGVTKLRQGFWPEKRPESGAVNQAQVELVGENATRAEAGARIVLHSGHQTVGQAYRRTHVDEPPVVTVPVGFRWEGEIARPAGDPKGQWWNPYWHFATPVTVGPLAGGEVDPVVRFRPDFSRYLVGCGQLDPASPRAVVHGERGMIALPTAFDEDSGEVVVTLTDSAWGSPAPATRDFRLYFDVIEMGGKCPGPVGSNPVATRVLNGSFEDGAKHWIFSGPRLHIDGAHTGKRGIELRWRNGMGPAVASNASMRLQPNSRYRVSFWAKSESARAQVRTNIYADGKYDFPQYAIPVNTGGQWRQFSTILTTGAFPPNINPALRLWVLGDEQVVYVDDVELVPLDEAPQGPPVQMGTLLRR